MATGDRLTYQSLASKLTVAMTALVIVTVGGLTVWSIQRERQQYQQELRQQAVTILSTMTAAARDSFYHRDFDTVNSLLDQLKTQIGDDQFQQGRIYQAEGLLVGDVNVPNLSIHNPKPDLLGRKFVQSSGAVFWEQDHVLVAGQAVRLGNQTVGAISIGLSTKPLQEKIVGTRNQGILVAVVAVITGAVIARIISRSIINPLQQLTTAIQSMTQGNLSQTLTINSGDEIAILADAFNHMSDRLSASMGALEERAIALQRSEANASEKAVQLQKTLVELHQAQAKLVHSEKMAGLGQLVAGVAHEINNPVGFIIGNIEPARLYTNQLLQLIKLYQHEYPRPPAKIAAMEQVIDIEFVSHDFPRLLASMETGASRIEAIVKSLRTFSRLDESECKVVDIHDGINSSLMILHSRLREQPHRPAIEVIKTYADLPRLRCYPGALNQVFMNILVNAIDALEDHWQSLHSFVPSRTQDCNMTERDRAPFIQSWQPKIQIETSQPRCDVALIKMTDNGPGIPESIGSKIFDPFFTTKEIGKGTGLGLSISYQIIVEQHQGHFWYQSLPQTGTTFLIEIPLIQQSRSLANQVFTNSLISR